MKNIALQFLKQQKTNPAAYLSALIFSVFLYLNFFFKNQFFTGKGTTDLTVLFSSVPLICILIIPALCSRTDAAIYDNFIPIPRFIKVLFDFLPRLAVYILILLTIVPATVCVSFFGKIDAGQAVSGFFCLILYGAAVISFTMFINRVFTNSTAAFIFSAAFLAVLNVSHLAPVYFTIGNKFSSLLKYISFAWHFDAATKGIIDTRDLTWFTGFTAIFLTLSWRICERQAGQNPPKNLKHLVTLIYAAAVLFIINGQVWYRRIDLSAAKTYSISDFSKKLAKTIENPLKITYYRSGSLAKLYPQVRDINDFMAQYSNMSQKISYQVQDPDKKDSIKKLLDAQGIKPEQMKTADKTSIQFMEVYSAMIIEYDGNTETIPFLLSADSLEYDLAGRIAHLTTGKSRTVNIITKDSTSLFEQQNYLSIWLNSQGFECNNLFADSPDFAKNLRLSVGPLLIAGDSYISIENAIAIEDYILSGKGGAFIMANQFSVDLENDWNLTFSRRTNIVEMIENWGVKFLDEVAADLYCSRITMVSDDGKSTQLINYPLWINILPQKNTNTGFTTFWAVPLEISQNSEGLVNASIEPYIVTSPAAWSKKADKQSKDKLIETNPFIVQSKQSSDSESGSKIIAARIKGALKGLYNLEESENSDVIVISDSNFSNSLALEYNGGEYGDYRNLNFITNSLLRLNNEDELADLESKQTRDTSLLIQAGSEEFEKLRTLSLAILFAAVPLLIIITFIINLAARKAAYAKN